MKQNNFLRFFKAKAYFFAIIWKILSTILAGIFALGSFYLPMVEVIKFLQTNDFKIYVVSGTDREICKKHVLAFGNSSGDLSMINYTINQNKYKSLGFFVICDDVEREFGKLKRAESDTALAKNNGWQTIKKIF